MSYVVGIAHFTSHSVNGDHGHRDWRSILIHFNTQFGQPPFVFVTAVGPDPGQSPAYPVPIVRDITNGQFTLAARNGGDDGFAGFSCVAIGS